MARYRVTVAAAALALAGPGAAQSTAQAPPPPCEPALVPNPFDPRPSNIAPARSDAPVATQPFALSGLSYGAPSPENPPSGYRTEVDAKPGVALTGPGIAGVGYLIARSGPGFTITPPRAGRLSYQASWNLTFTPDDSRVPPRGPCRVTAPFTVNVKRAKRTKVRFQRFTSAGGDGPLDLIRINLGGSGQDLRPLTVTLTSGRARRTLAIDLADIVRRGGGREGVGLPRSLRGTKRVGRLRAQVALGSETASDVRANVTVRLPFLGRGRTARTSLSAVVRRGKTPLGRVRTRLRCKSIDFSSPQQFCYFSGYRARRG